MNYEQFFPYELYNSQCVTHSYLIGSIFVSGLLSLMCLCATHKQGRQNEILKAENESLKTIILKSVDKMFVRMLKNGYDIDTDNE